MKKLLRIISAAIVGTAFMGVAASAQPLPTCDSIEITNTGPGSFNEGVCKVSVDVTLVCENDIYVLNENDQAAVTGEASTIGNTSGGPAITGSAENENGQTVSIGASCDGEAEAPGSGSIAPPAGGGGGALPAALPNTATSSLAPLAMASVIGAAAIALVSRLAVFAYRRFSAR